MVQSMRASSGDSSVSAPVSNSAGASSRSAERRSIVRTKVPDFMQELYHYLGLLCMEVLHKNLFCASSHAQCLPVFWKSSLWLTVVDEHLVEHDSVKVRDKQLAYSGAPE